MNLKVKEYENKQLGFKGGRGGGLTNIFIFVHSPKLWIKGSVFLTRTQHF